MDEQGQPHIDKAKVKAEERLDGKYLIRTSDDTLSPVDVALGYKQLYQVENAFRTLKTTLELRPVYHRLEDRIRSHILLCWLALLLVQGDGEPDRPDLGKDAAQSFPYSGDHAQNLIRQHDQNVHPEPGFEAIV